MIRLTILSPHRDDAIFSLYLALRKWRQSGVALTVLNFFTRSNYAPRVSEDQTEVISFIRKMEDHKVLSAIYRKIKIRDCDLLDAPLRLGIDFDAVCSPQTAAFARSVEAEIAACIKSQVPSDRMIAPLGLGGHVDHLAVKEAAIASVSRKHQLAFYEDLPYAAWTPNGVLQQRVHEIEVKVGTRLKPAIIRQRYGVQQKQRAAGRYESQISPGEAFFIAKFSSRFGGGERLWIPKHSQLWSLLTH